MLYGQRTDGMHHQIASLRVALRVSNRDFISTALLYLTGDDTGVIDAQVQRLRVFLTAPMG